MKASEGLDQNCSRPACVFGAHFNRRDAMTAEPEIRSLKSDPLRRRDSVARTNPTFKGWSRFQKSGTATKGHKAHKKILGRFTRYGAGKGAHNRWLKRKGPRMDTGEHGFLKSNRESKEREIRGREDRIMTGQNHSGEIIRSGFDLGGQLLRGIGPDFRQRGMIMRHRG